MKKFQIRQMFSQLHSAEEKEQFLKEHNIKYTYDCFNHLIIWCEDGVLELKPVYRRMEK